MDKKNLFIKSWSRPVSRPCQPFLGIVTNILDFASRVFQVLRCCRWWASAPGAAWLVFYKKKSIWGLMGRCFLQEMMPLCGSILQAKLKIQNRPNTSNIMKLFQKLLSLRNYTFDHYLLVCFFKINWMPKKEKFIDFQKYFLTDFISS